MEADLAARAMLHVDGDRTFGDAAERRGVSGAGVDGGSGAAISRVTRRAGAGARQQQPQPPSSLASLVMADLTATLPRDERVGVDATSGSARPVKTVYQARTVTTFVQP